MSDVARPKRRSGWGLLKFMFGLIVGLVVLVVVVGGALVANPPSWLVKDLLVRGFNDHTKQALTIDGDANLTLRPKPRLTLNEVALGDRQRRSASPPPLSAGRVEVDIDVVDLWKAKLDVPRLALTRPIITVRPQAGSDGDFDIELPRVVEINDGKIIIEDPPKAPVTFGAVTATLSREVGRDGVNVSGTLTARGEPIAFDGTFADLRALASGKTSQVEMSLKHDELDARATGALAFQPDQKFEGTINASTGSLNELLKSSGVETGSIDLGSRASLEGGIVATNQNVRMDAGKLTLDALTADVHADLSLDRERPVLKAKIVTGSLDADKLFPSPVEEPESAASSAPGASSSAEPVIPSAWDTLSEQLIRRRGGTTMSRASMAASGSYWSDDPFSLKALPAIELDLAISATELIYAALAWKNADLQVTSQNNRVGIVLKNAALDEGEVVGRADVGVNDGTLDAAIEMSFDGIALEGVLARFFGKRVLSGVGTGDVKLGGTGASMRALVGSLDGSATFSAERGEIIGVDLRRAVLELGVAQNYNPARRTRYDRFSGSVNVRDGIMRSARAFQFSGPQVDLTSTGSVGLVSHTLNQQLKLTVKPPPFRFPVPLRATGTLADPHISWDIFTALANPRRYDTPFSAARTKRPMPAETRRVIEGIISRRSPESAAVSEDVKEFLEELVETP